MQTRHRLYFADSSHMADIPNDGIQLAITSPPYPMIAMWDPLFGALDPKIRTALKGERGADAFERMHRTLDPVWAELYRVLIPGGIACINIGDATRSINGRFRLFPNHVRVMTRLLDCGFSALPMILWRKATNAPNKFMGSGMMPPGAYVTLEHEYILIVRKGGKRLFPDASEKRRRRESAYFWEERNRWFSDVWTDVIGAAQPLTDAGARKRSGAFPFEIPYRLIHMFSIRGDTVLDPFLGTGTTMHAAMAAGRHSVGYERDRGLHREITARLDHVIEYANAMIDERIRRHRDFVDQCRQNGKALRHTNSFTGMPVMTGQETDLRLNRLSQIEAPTPGTYVVTYDIAGESPPSHD